MNILDIVVLCLILLFALVGLYKGFFKSLVGLIGSLASSIASFFLAKPIASLLNNWFSVSEKFGSILSNQILKYFTPFSNLTGAEILNNNCTADGFIKTAFNFIIKPDTIYESETVLSNNVGNYIGTLATIAISFIIALILIKIVLLILSKLFDVLKSSSITLNSLDRVLGLVIGIAKCFIIISIVFIVASLLQGVPTVANALDKVFEGSRIAKPLYDFITSVANKYLANIDLKSLIPNSSLN